MRYKHVKPYLNMTMMKKTKSNTNIGRNIQLRQQANNELCITLNELFG